MFGVDVSSVGSSGGLALLWTKHTNVELISFSRFHMDSLVTLAESETQFHLTGIYGASETDRRAITWNLLRTLHSSEPKPWFVGGDFNEILANSEKVGGRPRAPAQMAAFNAALADCELSDMGFTGCPFTWSNNQTDPRTVRCRLDRVCANVEAMELYPEAYVEHVEHPGSDHIPIVLKLHRPAPLRNVSRCRPFRFEAMWVRKNDCEEIVRRVWEDSVAPDPMMRMIYNGAECRARLIQWSKDTNPNKLIEHKKKRIMELKGRTQLKEVKEEIANLTGTLEKLYRDQESYWQQRGKAAWLKDGDKNTSFFHAKATIRNQTNKIK